MRNIQRSRRVMLIAFAAGLVVLAAAAAVQASIPDTGGVIHGCYKTNQGTLRVIDTDQGQTCANSEVALKWLDSAHDLPPSCAAGQVPKSNGNNTWACAADDNTNYSNGTGLDLAGSQFSVSPNYRLPQACASGQVAKKQADGTWACAADDNTTYGAGSGLSLSGNTFGILGSYQLPQGCSANQSPYLQGIFPSHPWACFTAANAGESCASGKFVDGIDSSGDVTCNTPSSGGGGGSLPDVWFTQNLAHQDTPEHGDVTIATLSLPAGSFLLNAEGLASGDDNSSDIDAYCWFDSDPNLRERPAGHDEINFASFALSDVATLASPTDVNLFCHSDTPSTHVQSVEMSALKLGTVHVQ